MTIEKGLTNWNQFDDEEDEGDEEEDPLTPQERQKWDTDRASMISALQNFAAYFGAEEVFKQAKYLFEGTQSWQAFQNRERQQWREILSRELLELSNKIESERQKQIQERISGRHDRTSFKKTAKTRRPPEYDEAKKLLGG